MDTIFARKSKRKSMAPPLIQGPDDETIIQLPDINQKQDNDYGPIMPKTTKNEKTEKIEKADSRTSSNKKQRGFKK